MTTTLKTVKSHKDLKNFVLWPQTLYKGCDNWVPALVGDDFDSFNPKKNGALEFCEFELYLAYRGNETVGRVAAIINHKANGIWKENTVRFGWFDVINDKEVARLLLDKVKEFGKARNCVAIKGPLGFTDMDKEGLLIEGYENLCPFTCLYNYPYYDTILNELGFSKDVDWTQRILELPKELPDYFETVDAVAEKFNIHMLHCKSTKELGSKYGRAIFHMYNESFAPLFEFAPLTDRQIDMYLKTYVPILDSDYMAVCLNSNNEPVGFAFCVPSLAKALKKSNGRLLPFGLFRILHALKHNDTLEALMIGVKPEYQGKGVNHLMFKYIHMNCIKRGIKKVILNPQLEENFKVQSIFKRYEPSPYMRRRSYKASI